MNSNVQGVTPKTAILPDGWRKRLIPFSSPATNGVTALCLEIHDLWISKAAAGRPKDVEFCTALLDKETGNPENPACTPVKRPKSQKRKKKLRTRADIENKINRQANRFVRHLK